MKQSFKAFLPASKAISRFLAWELIVQNLRLCLLSELDEAGEDYNDAR